MDSSDKATTKAQSVAFRTALFQQFIVPTMAIDPESGLGVPTRDEELEEIAASAVDKFEAGNEYGAYEEVSVITNSEEQLKLWSLLKPHSKLRASIKAHAAQERANQDAPAGKK